MKLLSLSINGTPIRGAAGMPTGGVDSLRNILKFGVLFLFTISILIALFFLIYGGFKWMTSRGDKQKIEQAGQHLWYSIIGLIVVFIAFFILNIIGYFFGINLTSIPVF